MQVLKKIDGHLPLFTVLIVWSAIVVYAFSHMSSPPRMEPGQVLSYILTLVFASVLISGIPAIAVLYGWYTGKPVRAVILGTLLVPVIYGLGYLLISHGNMVFIRVPETILYLAALSLVCGLAGYCAARRTNRSLAVAIVLAGLWVLAAMSGIN